MPDQAMRGCRYFLSVLAQCLAIVLLCWMMGAHAAGEDEPFHVHEGAVTLRDGVFYLRAQIDFDLSEAAREALENGVTLTFELEINIEKYRRWLLNTDVAQLRQRYLVRYHALSERYILTNLNSGESRSFAEEAAVMAALGNIEALPLIDKRLLADGSAYEVWLQVRLDTEDLPPPLKALAIVFSDWRSTSDWFVWRIEV